MKFNLREGQSVFEVTDFDPVTQSQDELEAVIRELSTERLIVLALNGVLNFGYRAAAGKADTHGKQFTLAEACDYLIAKGEQSATTGEPTELDKTVASKALQQWGAIYDKAHPAPKKPGKDADADTVAAYDKAVTECKTARAVAQWAECIRKARANGEHNGYEFRLPQTKMVTLDGTPVTDDTPSENLREVYDETCHGYLSQWARHDRLFKSRKARQLL